MLSFNISYFLCSLILVVNFMPTFPMYIMLQCSVKLIFLIIVIDVHYLCFDVLAFVIVFPFVMVCSLFLVLYYIY